jgi:hypothetical protein
MMMTTTKQQQLNKLYRNMNPPHYGTFEETM